MACVYGIYEVVLYLLGHLMYGSLHRLSEQLYAALYALVLMLEALLPLCHEVVERVYVLLGQREHHLALERDDVAHVAAVPCGEACLALRYGLTHHTRHELVGIGAALVYLQA